MQQIKAELAPTGVLRAGINLSNFLLVSGKAPSGDPVGVAPDMAAEIAKRIGVPVRYVTFPSPGELADAAETNVWDIGLIGAEPQRAEKIAFTPAYVEIEATYLVPAGVRIAVFGRSAYGLWLERNVKHATLVRGDSIDASFKLFLDQKCDALAGLKPRLLKDVETLPGTRILDGRLTAVQQAIGTARANRAGAAFLERFVAEAKASGFVASLIARHKVRGLTVAG
jgi:polar amino acid transport system substrate-binding protein